jgi:hypothetical protein
VNDEPIETAPEELSELLDRVERRLRLRHAVHAAVYGTWGGCVLAALVLLASKIAWLGVDPIWLAGGAVLLGTACGLIAGLFRQTLDPTGRALLVDRQLGTREQIVSALEAGRLDPLGDPHELTAALIDRGRALASSLDPATAVPLARRRELRGLYFLPLALAGLVGLVFLPTFGSIALPLNPEQDPEVVDEGESLQQRIEEIQQQADAELPDDVREQLANLAEELQNEELTPEEARDKLEEMQEQLEQFQDELADKSQADELQQAAEELSNNEITEDLGEALQEPNLEQAAAEAEKLSEKMQEASAAEQQAAAGAMERAAEALSESNPELSQQMQQMAQEMKESGQQGNEGDPNSGMSQEQMQKLAQQLQQMQDSGMAEQLKQDEELMKMSQRLNGALESST